MNTYVLNKQGGWHPTRCGLVWVAGIALQLMQAVLWPAGWYLAGMGLAALLGVLVWRKPAMTKGLGYVAIGVLAFSQVGWRATQQQAKQLPDDLQGQLVYVTGQVVGLPNWQAHGSHFQLAVHGAHDAQGRAVAVPALISVGWFAPEDKTQSAKPTCDWCVWPSEQWRLPVKLQQVHGYRNPYGFDLELWMWQQGIGASGSVQAGQPAQRLQAAAWWRAPIDLARMQVRQKLMQWLHQPTSQRSAGVLAALVMGDQAAVDQADWEVFRITGVAHLMSISGMHVTMFAWLAGGVVTWLWRRSALWGWRCCWWLPAQQAGWLAGVLLALAYALFSGWGIPAQRTVLMLALVAALRWSGKQWPWQAVLSVAACLVTALDPWGLLQVGFWLSFVAVAILFLAADKAAALPEQPNWAQRMVHLAKAFAWQQWLVLLALTPLALLVFGQFSVIGFVANAMAVPVVSFVVVPLAMLGIVLPPLWNIADWVMQLQTLVLQWLASLSWASYSTAIAPMWIGVLGVVGGVLLAVRIPWPWRAQGLVLMLPVLFWQAPRPTQGEFDVLLLDVGQGGGSLVRTDQHSLMYDAGPGARNGNDAGQRIILPVLRALNETPSMLLLSHTDTDHAGGMRSLRTAFAQVPWVGGAPQAHALVQAGMQPCHAGQQWQWDGVDFQILSPQLDDYANSNNPNELSCVLRISNGKRTVILSGDAGVDQEQAILQRYPVAFLRADAINAGHHGSHTSTSPQWLDTLQPSVAWLQYGWRNRYGHPHASVVQLLQSKGIATVHTPLCGAAWWRSSSHQTVCERNIRRHYWQHAIFSERKSS